MKGRIVALAIVGLAAAGAFRATVGAQHAPPPPQTPPPQTAPPQQTPPQQQAPATSPEQSPRTVWDGVYSEEQAKRGEAVYVQECSHCHGLALEGTDESPPLTGLAFSANWNGLTVGDLFERIRISMPQDSPGKLTRQQNADVLAYMLSANTFPVGKTELPREIQVLKQILFEATKP